MTTRRNTIENKLIQHFSPGRQLYPLQSTKSSPQIYSDEFCRKVFDNRNILNISLSNCSILNICPGSFVFINVNPKLETKKTPTKKDDSQKKISSILSSAVTNHSYRCIALKCDIFFNTVESAAVFGIPLQKAVKLHPQVETAAAGLLCLKSGSTVIGHWSLGKRRENGISNIEQEISNVEVKKDRIVRR